MQEKIVESDNAVTDQKLKIEVVSTELKVIKVILLELLLKFKLILFSHTFFSGYTFIYIHIANLVDHMGLYVCFFS